MLSRLHVLSFAPALTCTSARLPVPHPIPPPAYTPHHSNLAICQLVRSSDNRMQSRIAVTCRVTEVDVAESSFHRVWMLASEDVAHVRARMNLLLATARPHAERELQVLATPSAHVEVVSAQLRPVPT
jgi:hypothetical protein